MNSTFYQTLINKKRDFPFWMWWMGVWLTAIAETFSSLVRVLTFGIIMPNWGTSVLYWSIQMQLNYLKSRASQP